MNTTQPMRRFLEYIGPSFMYSDNMHTNYKYGDRSTEILEKAMFLHLPKHKFQYVAIDLDWECSASLWMEEGYPQPTITIISPRTSHSKYLYELASPVTLPLNSTNRHVNLKPYKYFKAVKAGLDLAMGGDRSYSGSTVNNPFYKNPSNSIIVTEDGIVQNRWKVHWADVAYDLNYLQEFARPVRRSFTRSELYDVDSREKTMFNLTRIDACKNVNKFDDFHKFTEFVHDAAINHWQVLRLEEKSHPLEESEAKSVANSISKWLWNNKNAKWLEKFHWNVGALQLPSIDYYSMSKEDIESEMKRRRSLGAKHTHQIRRDATASRISEACERLVEKREKLTRINISKESGVGASTLSSYKSIINNYKSKTINTN